MWMVEKEICAFNGFISLYCMVMATLATVLPHLKRYKFLSIHVPTIKKNPSNQ